MYSSSYHVLCLTETWLSTTIYNKEILPSNFCIYRSDRPSRGGGAMICVSNSISSRLIASHSDIDLVIVQLLTSPCVILCCVYIPPNCSSSYFCSAISILETILTQHNHVIILGDFNLPDINWSSLTSPSPSSTILCDLIFKFNLIQMVNNATHSKGNILDLILTNIDYLISNMLITPSSNQLLSSDHFFISFDVCGLLNLRL